MRTEAQDLDVRDVAKAAATLRTDMKQQFELSFLVLTYVRWCLRYNTGYMLAAPAKNVTAR